MESFILVLTTVMFCFGLFIIFRLNQNSRQIEYKVETLEFSEYKEYQHSPTSVAEFEKKSTREIVAKAFETHQDIITKLLDKYKAIIKNLSEEADHPKAKGKTKTTKSAKSQIKTVIKSLEAQTDNAIAELGAINEILENFKTDFSEPHEINEIEEQKRRAAERIQKLRNLSFNLNAADPNNEFETVPAYIRRNLELYNTISPAQDFYSNYEVKTDETQDQTSQISTLNTYLDGKKPD